MTVKTLHSAVLLGLLVVGLTLGSPAEQAAAVAVAAVLAVHRWAQRRPARAMGSMPQARPTAAWKRAGLAA